MTEEDARSSMYMPQGTEEALRVQPLICGGKVKWISCGYGQTSAA